MGLIVKFTKGVATMTLVGFFGGVSACNTVVRTVSHPDPSKDFVTQAIENFPREFYNITARSFVEAVNNEP